MTLAFRLYGDFRWPLEGTPSVKGKGRVEIHSDAQWGGAGRGRCLLWWIPGTQIDDLTSPPPQPDRSLFDFTQEELEQWFESSRDTGGTLWLDRTDEDPGLNRTFAIFRGGFLLEQYCSDGKLDLQWPLVARCEYRSGVPVHSTLGLHYKNKRPLLYLNLHLPLPIRRTSLGDPTPENSAFFPFSVIYDLTQDATDGLPAITGLFGGWQAGDQFPKKSDGGKTSFAYKRQEYPRKRLGAFNFAEFGSNEDFAVFNWPTTGQVNQHYWPLNQRALLQDILWRYGFELEYNNVDGVRTTGDGGVVDSSLRFRNVEPGANSSSGRRSALIYRTAVKSAGKRDSGDLQVDGSDEALRLRLGDELGGQYVDEVQFGAPKGEIEGWLKTGSTLWVDCELAWEIAPEDIWSDDRGTDWAMTVTVKLHWKDSVRRADVGAVKADPRLPFHSGLLAQANFTFQEVRASLESGEAGRPHSFLPHLALKQASKPVRFTLYGSPLRADFKDNGVIVWGREAPQENLSPPWLRPPMKLTLTSERDLIKGAEAGEIQPLVLRADQATFFQEGGAFDLVLGHDSSWPPQSADSIEDGDPFFASFALIAEPADADAWHGRLASLKFKGTGKQDLPKNDRKQGHLRIGGRGTHLGYGRGGPVLTYPNGHVAVQISLPIPAATVEPEGVDVARVDRSGRPGPLLIPLNSSPDGGRANDLFWLTATETLSPTHDRRLEVTVTEHSQKAGERAYVVLAPEPYSIFRFTHQPLHARGQADAATVAFYSGDDRVWQYRQVSDFYHYTLPPQSIGESADKPGRLELHDLPPTDTTGGTPRPSTDIGPPLRPFVDESGLKRRAIEYRLTPPAEIWIRPSDVQRGYFMPESASHEIFRQSGQYGLGAALGYLRAEFLYGLSVGIDVSKERSISRGARIAEIEAMTGRLTGPARETGAKASLKHRWDAVRGAVARRPERLEVWARDLGSAIDFTPARFSDGVHFALRHTALHRAPLLDPEGSGEDGIYERKSDYSDPPRIAGLLPAPDTIPTALQANPRHHPQGLSGGALWPVESLNLFRALLQTPQSTGGSIESIALSPIGGDATQKAEFLGGKVTIISQTRNGYVERQQVEVLGRICALWHRAKHVVVYERTVNPSAQFAPKFDQDQQRTRSRRPILRKVSEYIELLQPERSYPDFSTAAPRSAGFLERVRFNSKIINVDSAWASEVEADGWQIPLWNRMSARERPQVYPMPGVAFVSFAEGEGDKPVVAQECLDPDYLFFFADVGPVSTADTDTWQPRLGLDYPNMPAAHMISSEVDAQSSEQPQQRGGFEKRRRAVGRILPGLRRFTWRLASATRKTAVNAGRADKPIYAGLDSVTFMRATHEETSGNKTLEEVAPELRKALDAARGASGWVEGEKKIAQLGYWKADGSGGIGSAEKFRQRKEDLINAIERGDGDGIKTALGELNTLLGGPLRAELKKIFSPPPQAFPAGAPPPANGTWQLEKFGGMSGLGKTGSSFCVVLKTDAMGTIQRKEMLVRSALKDWIAEADDILRKAIDDPDPANHLTNAAINFLRPLFAEASKDIGRIEEGVEKSRAILIDLEAEIEEVIKRARSRVHEYVNAYDQAKPWSTQRRSSFVNGLKTCVSAIGDDIAAAVDEARQRLGVELSEASQAIGGHVAKALGGIAAVKWDAVERITTVEFGVERLFAKIDFTLKEFVAATEGAPLEGLIALIIKKNENGDIDDDLKERAVKCLNAIRDQANAFIGNVRAKAQDLDALAQEAFADVAEAVEGVAGAMRETVRVPEQLAGKLESLAKEFRNEKGEIANDLAAAAEFLVGTFRGKLKEFVRAIEEINAQADRWSENLKSQIDAVVVPMSEFMEAALIEVRDAIRKIPAAIAPVIEDVKQAMEYARSTLAPDKLLEGVIKKEIMTPAFDTLLRGMDSIQAEARLSWLRKRLPLLADEVGERMSNISSTALDGLDQVTGVCNAVFEGVAEAEEFLRNLAEAPVEYVTQKLDEAKTALEQKLLNALGGTLQDVEGLIAAVKAFDYAVRGLHNNLSRAYDTARAFGNRVFEQAAKLGDGGIMAAPNNILKLYSAVTSAPEIAALKSDIDRIRSDFNELSDIIETTKANALFNRLGDELKALGLSFPFDKIGDSLLPADLSNFDIGQVFRNFGCKFDQLFKGYKLPASVRDAIRITHEFDEKQARAWVQVDIDAPMPGRRSLFSVGAFKVDFVDMRLTGQVRLEASKDTEKVTESGYGHVGTMIDLVAAGQSMVLFEKFGLGFTREKGLQVEFDPKSVRLNPSFRYIQDFLSTLFGDEAGGMQIVKDNGIPVGMQYDFVIPPVALNFATSGVSNISISNHFKLQAFPDFMLANRFNLSTVERPFIFSIFIIGGTGYIQVETQYRPFDSELMVAVEAGAGGSASFAFACGPFVGQVFITLSTVLTYRKLIGRPGGGLSISAVLVIAGHVEVAGIVTVGIVLMLRMTYRDNGQIDADGSLKVTIRISSFFKLTARANVKYKLRGGKSETVVTTGTNTQVTDERLQRLKEKFEKLEKARN
jgi:hypothetical protein